MATWTAPNNKQQTAVVAGPTSSQTLTFNTPMTGALLTVVVAWTTASAYTVAVSGGAGNSWVSLPAINNGNNYVQFWYVLSAANVATTVTATFTGNVTNIQLLNAEWTPNKTRYTISAASQSGNVTTYTCDQTTTPGEGSTNIVPNMNISITRMADAGNNTGGSNPAYFQIQSGPAQGSALTNQSLTVNNKNGVTHGTQTGTGLVYLDNTLTVKDVDVHAATGSSTAPASGALTTSWGNELWIGYGDAGTAIAWTAGTSYTLQSTNNTRCALEYNLNAGQGAAAAAFTISSNPWECGAVSFYISEEGATIAIPTVEATSTQAPFMIASTNSGSGGSGATGGGKFGILTDPYGDIGGGSSGSGNKVGQIYPTGRN